MSQIKLVAALILAVVAIVLIVQNTEPVETRILFATVVMPRAVLLLITTLVGFAAGILTALFWWRRSGAKDAGE